MICPAVPTIRHGNANDTNAIWSSIVEYTCRPGYRMDNFTTSTKIIECKDTGDAGGQWSEDPTDCIGK